MPKLTLAQYKEGLAIMRRRPGHTVDRRRRAPIARSYDQWKADPSRYDLKGVDAKKKKRRTAGPKKRIAKKRKLSPAQLAALAYGRRVKATKKSVGTARRRKSTTTKKRGTSASRSAAAKKAAATRARNKYGPAKMPKNWTDPAGGDTNDARYRPASNIPSGIASYGKAFTDRSNYGIINDPSKN